MNLLKRGASIYAGGFVFGVLASSALITVYPSLYYAFLEALLRKVEAQSQLIENTALMIIVNNIIAASIASFGGAALSKIVNVFDREVARSRKLLYSLPAGILFVNGTVLGFFAVLYVGYLSRYLSALFPHGFFEIPAIILSGAIGLEIAEEAQEGDVAFQRNLNDRSKEKIRKFAFAILLIVIGGVLEGGAV